MKRKIFLSIVLLLSINCFAQVQIPKARKVIVGADLLLSENFDLIKGKRLGIVTNHTALLDSKVHLVDTLFHRNDVKISVLFGPEHGIRGDNADGAKIEDGKDSKTGIPVYSLYGKINKPTKEMLKDVDVLIYDIQDVGARFYTFISTLFYTIQAAAENNIPVIVLDRPNPIGGLNVDGPILKQELTSFVGIAPIPIMHGMTVGELATMFNESGMIGKDLKANLTVIKMKSWERGLYFDKCNIHWLRPSPNIYYIVTAIIYPGTCLIEGTNASEGRGTEAPFQIIGAPYINSDTLYKAINNLKLKGVKFVATDFTPVEIANVASSPKYKGQLCHGIKINVTNRYNFNPVEFGISLISTLYNLYPKDFKFTASRFDKLSGDKSIREQIIAGKTPEEIISSWQKELNKFKDLRKKYLLY
ncbi:MAG: DUF1343 domain-containing protein [Ignavibacteriales bacterium]|nr:DUF1343 domain-containing protein [Ignavibacteriales bacterium]